MQGAPLFLPARLVSTSGSAESVEFLYASPIRADSVAATLRHREPWLGESAYRLELVQRAALWRYLSADDAFDVDWYQTRKEIRKELA